MSGSIATEKAARRAKALERLQETKRLMAAKSQAANASKGATDKQPNAYTVSGGGTTNAQKPGQAPVSSASIPNQSRSAENSQSKKSSLFAKPYIEFDFSTMEDSKGGYLVDEQNKDGDKQQENADWLESLSNQLPPFDFSDPRAPSCYECQTKELDFRLWRVFNARVCKDCRRKHPEKYSLLTKTECKQDYLLTESELRDKELLPHLERPNPYQQTYSNMMLYLRYQVEDFAWKKWGGPEQLDEEYEKRERLKKERKQARFEAKLKEMRNRTRAQAITKVGTVNKHVHIWGPPEDQDDGTKRRVCGGCGVSRTEYCM